MSNDNTAKPTADAYLICDDPANPNEAFVTCPAGYAVFHGSRFGREERARWFAEAGNVFNETGLTPRQLAEQRDELLKALRCAVNMDLPLIGSPTDEQLISYWAYEKEQGRGCADDMLFIMNTLITAEANP